ILECYKQLIYMCSKSLHSRCILGRITMRTTASYFIYTQLSEVQKVLTDDRIRNIQRLET
ncbi:hypothetical protein L9F63_020786, partial [Diploptera punctata]